MPNYDIKNQTNLEKKEHPTATQSKEERSKEPRRARGAGGNKRKARNTKLAQDPEQGYVLGVNEKNHEDTKDVEGKDRKPANERGKNEAGKTTGTWHLSDSQKIRRSDTRPQDGTRP